jgi:hypothetical protein
VGLLSSGKIVAHALGRRVLEAIKQSVCEGKWVERTREYLVLSKVQV